MNQALIDSKHFINSALEIEVLDSILNLLKWNQKITMPKKSASFRSHQLDSSQPTLLEIYRLPNCLQLSRRVAQVLE